VKLLRLFAPLLRRVLGRHIAMRRSQFEALPKRRGRVVFLGDSITEDGLWDEWFPDLPTLNRGIGGDSVGGVLDRVDSALHEPRAVSVLVGTNDLAGLGRSHRVGDIAEQMDALLAGIRAAAPDALLLVNGVMPRSKSLADDIEQLNRRYEELAARHGAVYVDLWPALVGPDRALRKDATSDGTHLNGAGYGIWVDILRPHLEPAAGGGPSD
jgi:lysophospholipase L1-like esterase